MKLNEIAHCDCGRVAYRKYNGWPTCQRCFEIEMQFRRWNDNKDWRLNFKHEPEPEQPSKYLDCAPIAGDSLKVLDARLAVIAGECAADLAVLSSLACV